MSDQRTRIICRISETPGIHFNELVRELNLASGQVQYHIRRLLQDGRVRRYHLYGRTHYYPPEYDEGEQRVLALLRRETARDILLYLIEHGPTAPATVADDLDIARSTLEWQLDRLTEQDLVAKQRDHRNRVTLVLQRPTETARLLAEIDPPFPERMVDRFVRLVDQLLEDAK